MTLRPFRDRIVSRPIASEAKAGGLMRSIMARRYAEMLVTAS